MKLIIDKNIYSDECISNAVYALADMYSIQRKSLSENKEELDIINEEQNNEIVRKVINTLNDYKLRCIIERETHDIKTILYAKAFMDCDDISENDMN